MTLGENSRLESDEKALTNLTRNSFRCLSKPYTMRHCHQVRITGAPALQSFGSEMSLSSKRRSSSSDLYFYNLVSFVSDERVKFMAHPGNIKHFPISAPALWKRSAPPHSHKGIHTSTAVIDLLPFFFYFIQSNLCNTFQHTFMWLKKKHSNLYDCQQIYG